MKNGKSKIILSIIFCLVLLTTSVAMMIFSNGKVASSATEKIIIHYCDKDYSGGIKKPYIYYWNSLPTNISVSWPGKKMTSLDEDGNYVYEFKGKTKINFLFTDGKKNQTKDLTVKKTGEYYYKDGRLTEGLIPPPDRSDFRDESIYFVMTTRFYDGDTSNNVHCWDSSRAHNPESDPEWRGDFKGLIQKLDYIKALGFSAIWITPVVENMSGYDFHGYHAHDFSKVDARYESDDCTYQDLINACHAKGIKIIQDIVLNHSCQYGEENIFPLVTAPEGEQPTYTNAVNSKNSIMDEDYTKVSVDKKESVRYKYLGRGYDREGRQVYHTPTGINFEGFTVTTGQFDGDCVDLNTENSYVSDYLINCYDKYINMGVDAFRIDTIKHISRLTLNKTFIPAFKKAGGENFYMFGEDAARVHETFNHGVYSVSPSFYTWKENKDYPWSDNPKDWKANLDSTEKEFNDNTAPEVARTSENAFLKGNDYHKPDTSEASGLDMIDFNMHWNFENANHAYNAAREADRYYNDATWNVVYVDSHDYGPDSDTRYDKGDKAWAENMDLMFTFRGIPCIYYGSEIEFQKGQKCDIGASGPLSTTGRAYFGDNIEGTVNTTDYGVYSNATGSMATTLSSPLAKQLERLNQIRRAIPALRKGQYSACDSGNIAFKRRYTGYDKLTGKDVDSFVCVAISGGAKFDNLPGGKYVDAITGQSINVPDGGTLTVDSIGQANMRVYVLQNSSTSTGKIGQDTDYLF